MPQWKVGFAKEMIWLFSMALREIVVIFVGKVLWMLTICRWQFLASQLALLIGYQLRTCNDVAHDACKLYLVPAMN